MIDRHPGFTLAIAVALASQAFAASTQPTAIPTNGIPTTAPATAPATQPATQPAARHFAPPVGNELADALKPAIADLAREMTQALREPLHASLRTQCDYFAKRPASVSPDALIDALNRRLDRDPRIDMYIRSQLLSIQKKPFEGNEADRALQLYVRSMPAPARPGASAIDQRRLTAEIAQLKQPDVEPYNANFEQAQRLNDLQFAPFWGYRDALYARLPKTFDLFRTALVDADQRFQGGYDAKPFVKMVFNDIRVWGNAANRNDVLKMSDIVQSYATREPTHRFTEVAFSDKKMSASWHTSSTRFDKRACDTLAADLRQMANAGF
ncbi:MAG: hypothetical protein ACTHLZ_00770 [Tepidisphaeraceae bacterium]